MTSCPAVAAPPRPSPRCPADRPVRPRRGPETAPPPPPMIATTTSGARIGAAASSRRGPRREHRRHHRPGPGQHGQRLIGQRQVAGGIDRNLGQPPAPPRAIPGPARRGGGCRAAAPAAPADRAAAAPAGRPDRPGPRRVLGPRRPRQLGGAVADAIGQPAGQVARRLHRPARGEATSTPGGSAAPVGRCSASGEITAGSGRPAAASQSARKPRDCASGPGQKKRAEHLLSLRRPGVTCAGMTHATGSDLTVLGIESSCDDTAAAVVRRHAGQPRDPVLGGAGPGRPARGLRRRGARDRRPGACRAAGSGGRAGAGRRRAGAGRARRHRGDRRAGADRRAGRRAWSPPAPSPPPPACRWSASTISPAMRCRRSWPGRWRFPICSCWPRAGIASSCCVDGPDRFHRLGGTIDDAPGEAFDKVAKILGLPQPGGPAVEAEAAGGDPARFRLPRPLIDRDGLDLSFSGLKTAVLRERDRLVAAPWRAAPAGPRRSLRRVPGRGGRGAGGQGRRAPSVSILRKTRPSRCSASPAASPATPACAPALTRLRRSARLPLPRAAAGALHRQRRDDRLGRHGADRPRRRAPTSSPARAGRWTPAARRCWARARRGPRHDRRRLGAGAFGTALALVLARAGREVVLWARDRRPGRRPPRKPAACPACACPAMSTSPATSPPSTTPRPCCWRCRCRRWAASSPQHRAALRRPPAGRLLQGDRPRHRRRPGRGDPRATCPGADPALISGPGFAADLAAGLPTAMTLGHAGPGGPALQALLSGTGPAALPRHRSGRGRDRRRGQERHRHRLRRGDRRRPGRKRPRRAADPRLCRDGPLRRGPRAPRRARSPGSRASAIWCSPPVRRSRATSATVWRSAGAKPPAAETVEGVPTTLALAEQARRWASRCR